MKKLLSLLLVLAMLATLTAGLSLAEEKLPEEDVELTIFLSNGDPLANEVNAHILKTFQEKYPMIKIVDITPTAASFTEGLKSVDAVGEFPDILEARDVPMWARAGKLAEMDPETVALVPNAPTFNGKNYCVPTTVSNPLGFFYNKAFFDKHGFAEPATYGEFLELCEKIKATGEMAPIVVGAADVWHIGFLWMQIYINELTSKNPDFIKHLYTGEAKWTDQIAVDCFTKYADLFKNGYVEEGFMSTPDNQITSLLVGGKAAMFISLTHMIKQIETADPNFEFGWFPLPCEDGSLRMMGGSTLSGLTYSADLAEDEDKLLAANLYIRYNFSDEIYKYMLETMSFFPSRPVELDYPSSIMNKITETLARANALELGWNAKWGDNEIPTAFRNFAYKIAQEWATGTKTVEQGLADMQTEWNVQAADFNPVTGVGIPE